MIFIDVCLSDLFHRMINSVLGKTQRVKTAETGFLLIHFTYAYRKHMDYNGCIEILFLPRDALQFHQVD